MFDRRSRVCAARLLPHPPPSRCRRAGHGCRPLQQQPRSSLDPRHPPGPFFIRSHQRLSIQRDAGHIQRVSSQYLSSRAGERGSVKRAKGGGDCEQGAVCKATYAQPRHRGRDTGPSSALPPDSITSGHWLRRRFSVHVWVEGLYDRCSALVWV
jgi:hypothetical protein